MKNLYRNLLLTVAFSIFGIATFAQNIQIQSRTFNSAEFDKMKSDGKFDSMKIGFKNPQNITHIKPKVQSSESKKGHEKSSSCDCLQHIDNTFFVAPFDSTGGNGGPGIAPEYRNDDWCTPMIDLPFTFCFYGVNYTQCIINNNGNITFAQANPVFTPTGLDNNTTYKIIAPFWADVDTRGGMPGGIVYYKVTAHALTVIWDSVGYFNEHIDKLDYFQCIITDGTDPLISGGNNVKFCYGVMQWTTGDASSGQGGLCVNASGAPGSVGASNGDLTNYIQFGKFGVAGNTFVGPFPTAYPNWDGIGWLDNQSFSFSTCNSGNNVPPINIGLNYCDTIRICVGDTVQIPASFLAPLVGENVRDTAWSTLNGFSILSDSSGNTASITVQVIGSINNLGNNTITFQAINNGTPNDTTTILVDVLVDSFNLAKPLTNPHGLILCPNATDSIWVNKPPQYSTYLWSNGSTTDTVAVGPGIYTVTVTCPNGCRAVTADTLIPVPNSIPVISGLNHHCPQDSISLFTGHYPSYLWSNGSTDSTIWVDTGTFTVTIHDTNGCVGTSLPFTVTNSGPSPTVNGHSPVCATDSTTLFVTPSFVTYNWSNGGSADSIKTGAGTYYVTCTDTAGCITKDSFIVISVPNPIVSITGTPTYCGNSGTTLTANPSGLTSYLWSNGASTDSTLFIAGFYSVTVTDSNGCKGIDTVTVIEYPNPTPVITGDSAFCANDTSTLTVNPAYTSYNWNNGSTTRSIRTDSTETWTVTVTDSHGCVGTSLAFNTTAYPAPVAYFYVNPADSARPDSLVQFTDSSYDVNGTIVQTIWYFGDGDSTSTILNPTHSYPKPGIYKVELIVVSNNGCRDTAWQDYIINVLTVIGPNVFTPNGDGKNDLLVFQNLTDYPGSHLRIYNRWGLKLYDDADYRNTWTGDGHPDGVYYYILSIADVKGTTLHGWIEIIR